MFYLFTVSTKPAQIIKFDFLVALYTLYFMRNLLKRCRDVYISGCSWVQKTQSTATESTACACVWWLKCIHCKQHAVCCVYRDIKEHAAGMNDTKAIKQTSGAWRGGGVFKLWAVWRHSWVNPQCWNFRSVLMNQVQQGCPANHSLGGTFHSRIDRWDEITDCFRVWMEG